ncbi:MAG: helix-turn-helix domain-containing protein [Nocardioides sp.]
MAVAAVTDTVVLVSYTGVSLTRATTFRFTLDVTAEQHQRLLAHAGAARLAYNHHLGRVGEPRPACRGAVLRDR